MMIQCEGSSCMCKNYKRECGNCYQNKMLEDYYMCDDFDEPVYDNEE